MEDQIKENTTIVAKIFSIVFFSRFFIFFSLHLLISFFFLCFFADFHTISTESFLGMFQAFIQFIVFDSSVWHFFLFLTLSFSLATLHSCLGFDVMPMFVCIYKIQIFNQKHSTNHSQMKNNKKMKRMATETFNIIDFICEIRKKKKKKKLFSFNR